MREEKSRQVIKVFFLGLVALLVVLDQAVKNSFTVSGKVVWNSGGIWGSYPGSGWFWVSMVILLLLILIWGRKKQPFWFQLGLGFLVAGGLGNLIDRVNYGAVRDYIYYPILSVYGNLADIFLGIGVLILIFAEFRKGRVLK